jgi:hypothetical protein
MATHPTVIELARLADLHRSLVTKVQHSLQRKRYSQMALDLTALNAIGDEIDTIASEFAAKAAAASAADQAQLDTAVGAVHTKVENLKTQVAQAIGSAGGSGGMAQPAALSIPPFVLPDGHVGQAYDATVATQGGTVPVVLALSSGALPDGIVMDGTGHFSGTPNPGAANATFSITATDATGASITTGASINMS